AEESDLEHQLTIKDTVLNKIISECIQNVSFYGIDLLYRAHFINNPKVKPSIPAKEILVVEKYLEEINEGLARKNITPEEKIELIEGLTTSTKNILDRIWELTEGKWLQHYEK